MLALGLALVLGPGVASAAASTFSLGQIGSPLATAGGCVSCTELQPGTESQSPTYAVPPGNWTLTSWSGQAGLADADVKLVVFRPTGAARQYRVVAEGAMETLNAMERGTFPVQIPVQAGDVLGLETGPAGTYPLIASLQPGEFFTSVIGEPAVDSTVGPGGEFATSGDEEHGGHLNIQATLTAATGALDVALTGAGSGRVTSAPAGISCGATACAGSFDLGSAVDLAAVPGLGSEFAGWSGAGCGGTGGCHVQVAAATNVEAAFLPSNGIELGRLVRSRRGGTARLAVSLPSPGSLALGGKGVKPLRRTVAKAGPLSLPIGARGRALRTLARTGKTRLKLALTFTPSGGTARTVQRSVVLVKPRAS